MKIKIGFKENGEPFELDVHQHLIERGLSVFGQRGSGKSYCIGKILEELAELGQTFVVIDTMGEYGTLREKYPVIVASIGSEDYSDLKNIRPEHAKVIAKTIFETGQSVVLNLKAGTMLDKYKFLVEFMPAFYQNAEKYEKPVVLVLDEAHRIIPEKGVIRLPELEKLQQKVNYYAYEIAATGRHHGIGFIVAARREAEVSKSVITQCEVELHFKTTGIDLNKLKEKVPKEFVEKARKLDKGEAVVIGFDEELIVRIDKRKCTHGGVTPEFRPVSISGDFIERFSKAIQEVRVEEEVEVKEAKKVVERYKKQIEDLKREVRKTQQERDELADEVSRLRRVIEQASETEDKLDELREQLEEAKQKIQELKERNEYLEQQLSEASKLEEERQKMNELLQGLRDWIMEASDIFGFDFIPKDVTEMKWRIEELEEELRRYRMTEQERKIQVEETLGDVRVKDWVRNAKSYLRELKSKKGVFPEVLKQALRFDPNTVFYPEDIDVEVREETIRNYLRELASRKLLIEARDRGKQGFKNSFRLWVTENIRKIRPSAPDEAIDTISEELLGFVYG